MREHGRGVTYPQVSGVERGGAWKDPQMQTETRKGMEHGRKDISFQ